MFYETATIQVQTVCNAHTIARLTARALGAISVTHITLPLSPTMTCLFVSASVYISFPSPAALEGGSSSVRYTFVNNDFACGTSLWGSTRSSTRIVDAPDGVCPVITRRAFGNGLESVLPDMLLWLKRLAEI